MSKTIKIPVKVTARMTRTVTYQQRASVRQHIEYEPVRQPIPISQTNKIEASAKTTVRHRPASLPRGVYSPAVESLYEEIDKRSKPEGSSSDEMYDVFISHASEDKAEFVKPLVEALQNSGIRVWYDEIEMVWGKSLREQIDNGIKRSKYAIVVLSKHFFEKTWTRRELDGILVKEEVTGARPLPIWYNITRDDVYAFSPTLAGLYSLTSDKNSIDEICKAFKLILEKEPIQET